jgi:hypothetical protein
VLQKYKAGKLNDDQAIMQYKPPLRVYEGTVSKQFVGQWWRRWGWHPLYTYVCLIFEIDGMRPRGNDIIYIYICMYVCMYVCICKYKYIYI